MSYLESRNFLFDIVRQLSKAVLVYRLQVPQLPLEELFVQNLSHTNTSPGSLVAVAGADSLACRPNLAPATFGLLKPVDHGVKIEADVCAVGDENALTHILEALLLQRGQFLEEAGNVDDRAGANEIDTGRGNETRRKDVEIVGHRVMNNGVAGILR